MSDTCPYCPPATPWGMAPQGFEQMRKWHDAGHPKQGNQVTDLATTDRNASTDVANPPKELPPTQQAEIRHFACEDGLEHRIGQAYDESRGTGNGPQICLKCKQTLASLVQAAATQRAIEELEKTRQFMDDLTSGRFMSGNDYTTKADRNWATFINDRIKQLRAQLGGGNG